MPIRKGGAKLWFKTQQEINEYDDKMIASIELTTLDFEDQNYAPVFTRPKREMFLSINEKAIQDANKIIAVSANPIEYINKYHAGKRDHTYNREWTFHRFGLGWGVSYLLLRELPIRNFYARCWIMFLCAAKMAQVSGTPFSLRANFVALADEWSNKDIRNYDAYNDNQFRVLPNNYNKLPQASLWKLSQPAYLRFTPWKYISTVKETLFTPEKKVIAWDGTFNMPLEGLAHPLHKDAKCVDFITA